MEIYSQRIFCYDTPDLFLDCKCSIPESFDQYDMHVHNLYELDYIISGHGCYHIEGKRYPIFPGCFLLIHPIDAHMTQVENDTTYERITFHFSRELLNEIDPSRTLEEFIAGLPSPQLTLSASAEGFFKQLFQGLYTLAETPKEYQGRMILSTLTVCLFTLRNLQRNSSEVTVSTGVNISQTIRKVLLYIHQHLAEDLSLDDLCRQFSISKSYLNKRFKEITGTTLWDYVLAKRLIIARQNIQNGVPIQTVYQNSGFRDYSNFYRCYIKRFGVSPKKDSANRSNLPRQSN